MLTATPVQNSLIELFNLLTLLKPGLLQTEAAFKKEYVDSRNGGIPRNPEKLRSLMREVMVRNTRALVDVKLPKRFATTITVTPTAGEEKLYQDLSDYLRASEDKLDRLSRTNLLILILYEVVLNEAVTIYRTPISLLNNTQYILKPFFRCSLFPASTKDL